MDHALSGGFRYALLHSIRLVNNLAERFSEVWRPVVRFDVRQRVALIGAVAIFVGMGVFPPWTYTFSYPGSKQAKPAGYAAIWSPPPAEKNSPAFGIKLDA